MNNPFPENRPGTDNFVRWQEFNTGQKHQGDDLCGCCQMRVWNEVEVESLLQEQRRRSWIVARREYLNDLSKMALIFGRSYSSADLVAFMQAKVIQNTTPPYDAESLYNL